MKLKRLLFIILFTLLVIPWQVNALTKLDLDSGKTDKKASSVKKKVAGTTVSKKSTKKHTRKVKRTNKKRSAPASVLPVNWISDVGRLYLKENKTVKEKNKLFNLLEISLGIKKNGSLNVVKAREAHAALRAYSFDPEKEFSDIYYDDKLDITGYNFIYFEVCAFNKNIKGNSFKRYFENGFYPNSSLFVKEEYYYKILYYYLYVIQDNLINKINTAIDSLNKNPDKAPNFTKSDIKSFDTTVKVCAELDEFKIKGKKVIASPYSRIFSKDDREWIDSIVKYFTDIETHIAIYSYPWFRQKIPLSVSAQVIAHDIRETWIDQTISHRAMLPLMLFTSEGDLQFSVEKLFSNTLNKLKLDNREVDVVVMSALKTWLGKQSEHGIKVEDRIKYSQILDELQVCPSGWIFYNLYTCREPLEKLKSYAKKWDSYSTSEKAKLFNEKIVYLYADAEEKINTVFADLEKLFGKVQVFGREQKTSSINHVFHRYKGEISYYYEYLQFGLYEDNIGSKRFPLANSRTNCLFDFKAAFVKDYKSKVNHKNLLAAYNLLFQELASQGKVSYIIRFEEELETFINNEIYQLGSLVSHSDDDRYEIYRIIANSYLSNKELHTQALKIAERSYQLALKYYTKAATEAGYVYNGQPGALNNNWTQIDDFERQYEFYQEIAKKLGKKIWLLLPNEDVQLYNRLQDLRNPEGFLL